MTRLRHTRSSLFLIELIIAILFFSAGSAVCIRAFAQAHEMSRAASDLSFASAQVSSAASAVRYTDGSAAALAEYFPGAVQAEDSQTCLVYYDQAHQPCSLDAAAYVLTIHTMNNGGRTDASLSMTGPDGSVLYSLELRYPGAASPHNEE